ncbi:putative HMP/thiamine import ATP-binding protein YkoD [Microbacterium barkeri]|uniref:HMP/thiamine import ATP-binding protein YkoD n=1 Tax=Microbacterium barkeri TaxID=33917 RepID=A0A9W6H375_9MICO|nr:ABC transporter ATP-binding protein [Microbacterium barkeri]MDR6877976.1 energy-coupling factor transport system ATP-binding protein [Microbacterium barkeri]GLJ61801.1 putative HMP/thiamine import ATP-binding protein YkoD [Microbacterium barkeri]
MTPADDETLLRVREVSVAYPESERRAPDGVTFEVRRGEVLLVLGPSGSGKSTLALTLDGLIPHAIDAELAGTVEVDGIDTRDSSPARLSTRVGIVFQDPDAQIVTATVLDEVAFTLENLLLPVDEVLSRSEAALRRVGLWEQRDLDPDALSGGGRQRLAIACALAARADVVVLDEPTANLDPQGVADVYEALHDLVSAGDRAIVLIEHDLDAAVAFATRAIVLDASGRLAFDGPVVEVLRTRVDALERMGVWLPSALIAARRLERQGWRFDALPLTPDELASALNGQEPPSGIAPSPAATTRGVEARGTAVSVRGLTVRLGRAVAIRDVDLDLPAGSFTAVVGPNGAGKTTLVQAIAGVVAPPKRSVSVQGLDVGRASAREISARVGFVFQNPEHQFIAHTVFDELAHGLRIRRVPEPEIRERVGDMLERFGLTAHADAHPFRLSGGQKRRLSVGTALITAPSVLVLDEPTFGQDRARAEELLAILTRLHEAGTTVVIVTHDLSVVEQHATHVAVVADGTVVGFGAAADALDDAGLLARAGLRPPPLRRVLAAHPAAAAALEAEVPA